MADLQQEEQDLSTAFEEALKKIAPEPTTSTAAPAATVTPPVAATPEVPAAPVVTPPATPAVETPAAPVVTPATPPVAAAPAAPAAPAQPSPLDKTIDQIKAGLPPVPPAAPAAPVAPPVAAAPPATPPAAPAPAAPAKQPDEIRDPIDDLTAEEKAQLQTLDDDWSEVAGGVKVLQKVMGGRVAMLMGAYNERVANYVNGLVTRVSQLEQKLNTMQTSSIEGYGDLHTKVAAWVDTIPEGFRAPYKAALDSGDPARFVQLAEAYKTHVKDIAPATETPLAPAQNQPPNRNPADVSHLRPVGGGSRGTMPSVIDSEDEEGAFNEALLRQRTG